ncbi:MAG: hypothetical protein ABR927_17700 [Bacteroidales bacterium]|jgi:predicted protein tyrosine phosphatase
MRSRSAECIYASNDLHHVRSAGTAQTAKVKVSPELIYWADIIFAMEEKQAIFINRKFNVEIGNKKIINLNIPDCYYFMEPELAELIKSKVSPYLEE